ncbi:hypothetical protein Lser_V15G38750 [Lactuca serriola]
MMLSAVPQSTTKIRDLLILACSHAENRNRLTKMDEWPEWISEILISNYETSGKNASMSSSFKDVEYLVHSFLVIMLEHSMHQNDGWKDIEATIHYAKGISMVGGSSTGEQDVRNHCPSLKKGSYVGCWTLLLGSCRLRTKVIAATAVGVAAYGLPPEVSKVEVENVAQISMLISEE